MARKGKKKKSRPRDEEEVDDDLDEALPPPPPRKAGPPTDAYVGMLAVSFVALLTTAGLLYLDFDALSGQQVSPPAVAVPALGMATTTTPPTR